MVMLVSTNTITHREIRPALQATPAFVRTPSGSSNHRRNVLWILAEDLGPQWG
jgi:hypothetical protein